MTKGSVILNGVRYEDTSANILIDDKPKTAASLQSGMVVKVKGSANGPNGTAERVEAQVEVRGTVTIKNAAANPQSFVVLGQTVIVDDQTIYSNLPNSFASIIVGNVVEVYGLRDATGQVRATRIEGSQTAKPNGTGMADPDQDEIRGVVKNLTLPLGFPATFTLGTQAILVNDVNVITPAGATLANDIVVEVHCARGVSGCINVSSQFVATRVDVESAEDAEFEPSANQEFEVEGLVSQFAPGTFLVAGVSVTTSASTVFEGGIEADLGNDVEVEAEGVWSGTTLAATKIRFEREVIRLGGTPGTPTGNTFTLQIAGLAPVTIEALDGVAPPVGGEPCVEVKGQRKAGTPVGTLVVIATEIAMSCSSGDHLIQAPVEAESGTTLTLLSFPIDVGKDTPQYENTDGSPMTSTAFFTAVVPASPGPPAVAGTLVKVRFNTPLTTVKQVELED